MGSEVKLLVSGCSVTHGTELYNKFMHPNNVKLSYSQHLADKLGCEVLNVAMPAASNEYIFHSLIKELTNRSDIHSVIVMWTSHSRLYWKCNDRHYFVLGNFASSMIDPVKFSEGATARHENRLNGSWFTGDTSEVVDKLSGVHKFFVTDYFDDSDARQKLKHYKATLTALCQIKNIKLINIDWDYIANISDMTKSNRHPNAKEHEQIAELIYNDYYEINK